MNITEVLIQDVTPGMVIWRSGYRWTVKTNRFEADGNYPGQARHVLTCDANDPEGGREIDRVPTGYRKNCATGALVGTPITVERIA